ncbi:MAG: site-2 protease family protein [Deltaproteobacteria bacterium]|nr:site-2 protease family protein [Deltaproteobacteria bacterium]
MHNAVELLREGAAAGLLSGVNIFFAILAVGVLIAVHEFGHYLVARVVGMRVIRYSIGFGPPLLIWKHADIEYALSAIPLGGYVHVFGMSPAEPGAAEDPRSYQRRPRWARALVCLAGPIFSYGLGVLGYFTFFFVGQTAQERVYEVAEVLPGTAAEEAGLQVGDQIGLLNDHLPRSSDDFGAYIDQHKGEELVLVIDRKGELMKVTAQLPPESTDKGLLGIRYAERINQVPVDTSLPEAIKAGFVTSYRQSLLVLSALGRLFTKPSEVEVGGVPAIVNELKKSADRGLLDFIWLLAGLTVMFGLLNLLPVPALDGSKVLLLGVEGLTGRDLPARFQLVFHGVGFLLLLGLMVIVSISDVFKMVGK